MANDTMSRKDDERDKYMKKRVVWLAVLLVSLLLCGTALGTALPPQTAGEVPVPDHTVPVVTNVQISGNIVTMDVSGPFDQGGAIIYAITPSGRAQQYVIFTKVGDTLVGEITGLPPDATGWEMDTICVYMVGAPDAFSYFYYEPDGALQVYTVEDSATHARYFFSNAGRLTRYYTGEMDVVYDQDGSLYMYRVETATGQQQYNSQYQLVFEESTDPDTGTMTESSYENGVLMVRTVTHADNSQYEYDGQGTLRRSRIPGEGGTVTDNTYDVNGNLHSYVLRNGYRYEQYDAAGNLVTVHNYDGTTYTYEEFENGQVVYKSISGELPDGRDYDDIYENGVYTERIIYEEDGDYHYDAKGNYTGKTVYTGEFEYKTYDASGVLIEYSAYSDQQGGVWLTYNSRNVLLSLEYYEPYFYNSYYYDAKEKVWYLNGVRYDGPVPIDIDELKLPTEIVWYPNNTVCSFGPQFRDIDPNLTKLWYMFTPIDLSRDGTQTFELIGGNVYVLGHVFVTVNGDSVTVTYETVKGKYGHIYMKSEYLNFFKDLASVTTVVPEEIGEGFKFGQTISIQNDLDGDTNVLMFVRNVATFRNFVDHDTLLRRYYKNHPSRVKLREAMLDLMD